MKRLAVVLSLAVWFLVGCGGGGGDSPTPQAKQSSMTYIADRPLVSMVPASFARGIKHVVAAGWGYGGGVLSQPIPVKIYQINSNGSGADVTKDILGSEQLALTNVPLIADFNNDGIDDIFLPGFADAGTMTSTGLVETLTPSIVFISRPGQSHQRIELPDKTWSHGAAMVDLNNDGHIDVINNHGQMWINDGKGNFQFKQHNWYTNTTPGLWMHGSGVCAGDFNNTGRKQIVITDLMVDANIGPIADTVIFELNSELAPIVSHTLPVPVLDRNTTTSDASHDVGCVSVDLNNDGLLDILVFSRPNTTVNTSNWTNQGVVQVLVNRGNWKFDDITDVAMVGYPINTLISYTPIVADFNGDGNPDLWMGYFDFDSGLANHAWINNGAGIFTRTLKSIIDSFKSNGPMVPIKFNEGYAFVYSILTPEHGLTLYVTPPQYTFDRAN